MSFPLRASIVIACALLLIYVVYLVRRERLQLKYSLLWLAMAVVLLLVSLFPEPLFTLSDMFGFATASNFIFVAGFIFLLTICLVLTSIASKQTVSIKNLTQRIAILENENRENKARSRML